MVSIQIVFNLFIGIQSYSFFAKNNHTHWKLAKRYGILLNEYSYSSTQIIAQYVIFIHTHMMLLLLFIDFLNDVKFIFEVDFSEWNYVWFSNFRSDEHWTYSVTHIMYWVTLIFTDLNVKNKHLHVIFGAYVIIGCDVMRNESPSSTESKLLYFYECVSFCTLSLSQSNCHLHNKSVWSGTNEWHTTITAQQHMITLCVCVCFDSVFFSNDFRLNKNLIIDFPLICRRISDLFNAEKCT